MKASRNSAFGSTHLSTECPAITPHQSGGIPTSLLWSTTSYWVQSGTRGTRRPPASAAPVRSSPWCPSVPSGQEVWPLANERRQQETRCWTWRTGTSLTTWLKPTRVSSEPGGFLHSYDSNWENWKCFKKPNRKGCWRRQKNTSLNSSDDDDDDAWNNIHIP